MDVVVLEVDTGDKDVGVAGLVVIVAGGTGGTVDGQLMVCGLDFGG